MRRAVKSSVPWTRPAQRHPRPPEKSRRSRPTPSMFLGVRLEDIVRWAGVSPSHARLVKTGIRKPSLQVQRLVTLHDGGQVLRGRWEGWRCRGDKLVSPEGVQFDASALEHHRLVLQFARELAAQSGGGAYERFWELLA